MPRRPRINLAGVPQHIVQRGINREPCFFAEEDYHCHLHWLEKAAVDWRCVVHAYLLGGIGNDTYVINPNDGYDTVLDSDGLGVIVLDGATLAGGALVAGTTNVWKNTTQGITYTLKGSGASQVLLVSRDGGADGIRVQGWSSGQLGLTMADAPAPSATPPIVGLDGYSDALTGTGGADLMQGLSGNDALDGSAGDDILEGGVGDDLLAGNSGSDLIYGGAGRDMILAATGLSLEYFAPGESWNPPAGAGAVWTQGRVWGVYAKADGSSYVVDGGGSLSQDSAPDIVFAGDDDDRVVGGLGADYIDGGLRSARFPPMHLLCATFKLNHSQNHRLACIYN